MRLAHQKYTNQYKDDKETIWLDLVFRHLAWRVNGKRNCQLARLRIFAFRLDTLVYHQMTQTRVANLHRRETPNATIPSGDMLRSHRPSGKLHFQRKMARKGTQLNNSVVGSPLRSHRPKRGFAGFVFFARLMDATEGRCSLVPRLLLGKVTVVPPGQRFV